MIKSVCIFCGSNPGKGTAYREAAISVGETLARSGMRVVYGGSSVGLMAALADAAMAAGGEVIGVIPRLLVEREQAAREITQLHIVDSMHERKAMMARLSDAFIALPGGLGTLDEIFEMLTWGQLAIHAKPCGFLNVDGYYDSLLEFLDHACAQQFLRAEHRATVLVANDIDALLRQFQRLQS
jgi:uncharacterized protein (TIGR00730 family)